MTKVKAPLIDRHLADWNREAFRLYGYHLCCAENMVAIGAALAEIAAVLKDMAEVKITVERRPLEQEPKPCPATEEAGRSLLPYLPTGSIVRPR